MEVFKFGGASVKDASAIRNIKEILKTQPDQSRVIVVSAMGKTTNNLQTIASQIVKGKPTDNEIEACISFHEETCVALIGNVPERWIRTKQKFLEDLLLVPKNELEFFDRIIAYGELFSTLIIAEYLGLEWIDARDFIQTDDKYSEAEVDWNTTEALIKGKLSKYLEADSVVTQGFIGRGVSGKTTTLGREGSDYSAAIFANCLNAEKLTVWKDVPGLLTADPKILSEAQKFDHISYQEVIEMTYYGAKVIHPKTIYPLAQKSIPLFVRSFLDSSAPGTEISEDRKLATQPCFVFKQDQVLFTARVRDNSFMDERKMSRILMILSELHVKANLMQNSALTFTFCVDEDSRKQQLVLDALGGEFQLLYNEGLWLLTIKNYDAVSFDVIPFRAEKLIEEKTRLNYQVVYRLDELS